MYLHIYIHTYTYICVHVNVMYVNTIDHSIKLILIYFMEEKIFYVYVYIFLQFLYFLFFITTYFLKSSSFLKFKILRHTRFFILRCM